MAVGVGKVKAYFRLGDRNLVLDYRKVPANGWRAIKSTTGFTQSTLIKAVLEADIDAVVALVYLERVQRERNLNYLTVQNELDAADTEFEFQALSANGNTIGEIPGDDPGEDPTTAQS
jgi:hypothetical protein